jgi:hypothetical protein
MGHANAGNIETRFHHGDERFGGSRGRANSGNDFCATHRVLQRRGTSDETVEPFETTLYQGRQLRSRSIQIQHQLNGNCQISYSSEFALMAKAHLMR